MLQPAIVLTGAPVWAEAIADKLGSDYRLARYSDRFNYVERLADDHAAFIIVDGDHEDWQGWVTSPKVHNATRRIPVLLISDEADIRSAALLSGADMTFTAAEAIRQIKRLVQDFARIVSPQTIERLEGACREPLPPLVVQGIEHFNAGEFYRQHDLLEEQWMATDGPIRDLYRAILQVGVAYYQITRGNGRGAKKMLLRSVQWLSILPDVCQGVDVRGLREDSYRVRAELERLGEDNIAAFDQRLLKPVKRVDE
jgi:hypothetical protein